MQHTTGLLTVLNEGGAQGRVARLQVTKAAQQRVTIERAFKPQRCRNVVRAAGGVQLPDNPLALLGIRQHRWRTLRLWAQRGHAGGARPGFAVGGKFTEHAGFKQAAQRQFDIQLLTNTRYHLCHQQRMAAQLKEVVIAAHRIELQDLLPDRSNAGLNPGMGGNDFTLPIGGLRLWQRLAVNLAIGIQRQAGQTQPLLRHHVVGQLRLKAGVQLLTQRAPLLRLIIGDHKGHQGFAGWAILHHHGGFSHTLGATQARFNFAQLDTETAHLDLLVDTTDVFQLAVHAPPSQVAGAVQTLTRLLSERVGHEHRSAALRVAEITTAHARACHVQLAHHAARHRLQPAIEHIQTVVVSGQTNRQVRPFDRGGIHPKQRHVIGTFRRAIGVDQTDVRVTLQPAPRQRGRHGLASGHHPAQVGQRAMRLIEQALNQ